MHLLRVLSETTSQSITEIMEPHKDILNEMIPPKKHLLRYQPANAQIGLMVCRFCIPLVLFMCTSDEEIDRDVVLLGLSICVDVQN